MYHKMLRVLQSGLGLGVASTGGGTDPATAATTPPPWREHADAFMDTALTEENHAAALVALHARGATGLMELVGLRPGVLSPARKIQRRRERVAAQRGGHESCATSRCTPLCRSAERSSRR
jgi:hypothetical protein